MNDIAIISIWLPFVGTALGAACVFFIKRSRGRGLQNALTAFAAGVMLAASVWSLLIPSFNASANMGKLSFLPAVAGFWVGVLFLHLTEKMPTTYTRAMGDNGLLVLAVVLHNIPEGMAVGVALAGAMSAAGTLTYAEVLVLSIGITVQNIPEGAIISMPLGAAGGSGRTAFAYGMLSGAVEPLFAWLTVLGVGLVAPLLPYVLGFAAGAMIYVAVTELIPRSAKNDGGDGGIIAFSVGFCVMMVLDVVLG